MNSNLIEILILAVSVVVLIMNFVLLKKMGAIFHQVKMPSVRKMSNDLKLKKVRNPRNSDSGNRNRNQGGKNRSDRNSSGSRGKNNRSNNNGNNPRGRAMKAATPSEVFSNESSAKTEAKSDGNKNSKNNRNANDQKRNGQNRNRSQNSNRSQRAPKSEESVEETPKKEAPVVATKESAPKGRPTLAPRGNDQNAPSAEAPKPAESSSQSSAPAVEKKAEEVKPKVIRHGRRNQVRKVPKIEDEAPAS